MYKLEQAGGIIKDGRMHIPNDPANRHWVEFKEWEARGNIPLPAAPVPVPEAPIPSVTEIVKALDKRDKGDSRDWDAIVAIEKPRSKES